MTDPVKPPRRFPTGELIGVGALAISALGLWNSWQSGEKPGPTEVVERKVAVPLVLRGRADEDGRQVEIAPVESTHALVSLQLAFPGGQSIDLGSDGRLGADDVADALGEDVERKGAGRTTVNTTARYVEAGQEKTAKGRYAVSWRWEGGGLLSGKKLRLTGFSRG